MNNLWCKALFVLGFNCGITAITVVFNLSLILGNSSAVASESDKSGMSATSPAVESSIKAQPADSFCESLGMGYREHYNFETHNFNVSICRHGADWYYYRKSKTDPDSAILVPAQIVFNEETFKAVHGKTIYFVGINSEGYYSSVMHSNNQIIFEPELKEKSKTVPSQETDTTMEIVNKEIIKKVKSSK